MLWNLSLAMLTYSQNSIANAAREAARYGIVHSSETSTIQAVALNFPVMPLIFIEPTNS